MAGNIAASTISGDKIVGSSITGDKIAGNTITGGKIAGNTITANNILAGTISSTQIAANTIVAGNIAASTISGDKIVGSSITGDKIAGNTITAGNISSNTITADNILTGTITALKIATGTITGDKISGNTIAGSNIIGTTITGDKIAALAITSDKISVTNLAAINANMGAITAGTLTSTNWNGTNGSYFNMNTGVLQIGGYSAPKFNFDGTNLSLNVDTFKISNASTNVFTVEAGSVRIDGNFIVNGTTNTLAIADHAVTGMGTATGASGAVLNGAIGTIQSLGFTNTTSTSVAIWFAFTYNVKYPLFDVELIIDSTQQILFRVAPFYTSPFWVPLYDTISYHIANVSLTTGWHGYYLRIWNYSGDPSAAIYETVNYQNATLTVIELKK